MPKYTFVTNHFVHIEGSRYKPTSFEVEADDVEKAYAIALPQFPDGYKLFCWYSNEPFKEEEEEDGK